MNGDGGRSSTPSGEGPGASNAPGTRENYLCSGHKIHQPTPNSSSSKRRRLERPADESLSESPVEVAKPNADGSGVDPPSQVAESSDLVEDDATPLLEPPACTHEWKQLLSSDLGNETLRNIARDVGDKAMNKMLSLEASRERVRQRGSGPKESQS
ncbi:hypothetical protein THAOC_37368 [Thalassiosira oceanica]|uniref:Uncharacterized protein n=1 Tax=Thalassiosira oceanica TaxID=159749 RepID=K0R6A2_THAOC|nr:hypothetical protein THAOC_37368 [Thalassiosira oceanica]|eukprot:EJK44121.1 hypothetical protein THAOC_37368 [Thalassiosira oceanica]